MMENIDKQISDFELEAMINTAERESKGGGYCKGAGYFFWHVEIALKELKARRKDEKEQMELRYFSRGVVENGRLYMDIPTDDKKPGETILESVKPIPVKRCKIDGVEQDVKEWTVKQWLQKINEELDEFKREVLVWNGLGCVPTINSVSEQKIREEAIDTITVVTSMLEAMGIDEEQRDEAQRLVNEKNRQRGRL